MSAERNQVRLAGRESRVQVETAVAAAGTLADRRLRIDGDQDGGPLKMFGHAAGDDPDHARDANRRSGE